jgi:hypothetical protein
LNQSYGIFIHATQAVPPTCQRNSWVACSSHHQKNTLFDSQKSIRPDWDCVFLQDIQLHQLLDLFSLMVLREAMDVRNWTNPSHQISTAWHDVVEEI